MTAGFLVRSPRPNSTGRFLRYVGGLAGVWLAATMCAGSALAHNAAHGPVALVTSETQNELIAISLPGGQILRRVHVAADPETVVAHLDGPAYVVSPGTGTVTVLAHETLKPIAVLDNFADPQVAGLSTDGHWVYVTDAVTGDVSVIDTSNFHVVGHVFAGMGAHEMGLSPDQSRAWVALGESAKTIVVLDTTKPSRPRVLKRIQLSTPIHDPAFSPDGKTVWVSSSKAGHVSIYDARSGAFIRTVAAGKAPQHIAFDLSGHAYIASGDHAEIEVVNDRTFKVLRSAPLPYGSFNLTAAGGIVGVSSLYNGIVTAFEGASLHRLLSKKVGPKARDLAISMWD